MALQNFDKILMQSAETVMIMFKGQVNMHLKK